MTACLKPHFDEASKNARTPKLLRRMSGSAQSILIRDSADHQWIAKLKCDLQGPNALANEMLGTFLCRSIGLPVPDAKVMWLSDAFFADRRTWIHTAIGYERPKEGLHFVSRFFPESSGKETIDFLPPALRPALANRKDCLGIFLFDVWAAHADTRQALYYSQDDRVRVIFIDHGHLFGGPNWAIPWVVTGGRMLQRFAVQDSEDSQALDAWIAIMRAKLPHAFEEVLDTIPHSWYTGNLLALRRTFVQRLTRLDSLAQASLEATRIKIEVMSASERRLADSPLYIMSNGGAEYRI